MPNSNIREIVIAVVCLVICVYTLFFFLPQKGQVKVIDCTISEISPDFTIAMREACRQARAQKN